MILLKLQKEKKKSIYRQKLEDWKVKADKHLQNEIDKYKKNLEKEQKKKEELEKLEIEKKMEKEISSFLEKFEKQKQSEVKKLEKKYQDTELLTKQLQKYFFMSHTPAWNDPWIQIS